MQGLQNYSDYTLAQLPPGRYEITFQGKGDTNKSAKLEIQPYGGKLRVRFLSGDAVKCGGRFIENSQWTLLNLDLEKSVEKSLYEMIQFN